MSEQLKRSLSGMWLLVSAFALFFPIFLPSAAGSGLSTNPIGTATVTMFILSFPSSILGIPLLIIADYGLGVEPTSIQGMYVNLLLLFVIGLVQWFWILPRIGRSEPAMQLLKLPRSPNRLLMARGRVDAWDHFGTDDTPLERVLRDDE